MAEGPILELQGLTKRFGDFTAVKDVSFSIHRGEIFGFLGPNGAGKSTTIRMLCGVLLPTSGQARALGRDLFTEADLVRSRIGYMSQKSSLLGELTVDENLRFFGGLYGLSGDRLQREIEHRLREMQVLPLRHQRVSALSSGERQRVSLASSTLHQPELLFLDEPTSGVDPLRRRLFWQAMDDLIKDGMTILVTTHNLAEADQCSRLAFILAGELMAIGSPRELKSAMGQRVMVLRSERFRELRSAARSLPDVRAAVLQGRAVRVSFLEATPAEHVLRALAATGIPFQPDAAEMPSLEDLFVDLVERSRRAA
jgi:ABC-2 type transport system ATP-binding protein